MAASVSTKPIGLFYPMHATRVDKKLVNGLIYCEVLRLTDERTVGWITRLNFKSPYQAWYCDGRRKAAATTQSYSGARGWLLKQAALPSPAPPDQSKEASIARREANWLTHPKFSVPVRIVSKPAAPTHLVKGFAQPH